MKDLKFLRLFSQGEAAGDIGETDGLATRQAAQEDAPSLPPKMTWQEVKADPELNQHLQQMVKDRLKSARHAQDRLTALTPALQLLAETYGLQEDFDPQQLQEAILRRRPNQQDLHSHFQRLTQQAEALQQQIPDFSLHEALNDPVFLRLTAPGGVSVEDAYFALHRQDAMAATAVTAARNISNALLSGAMRPQENGGTDQGPTVTSFDYRSADRSQRENLKKKIRMATARGEKVYPNDLF